MKARTRTRLCLSHVMAQTLAPRAARRRGAGRGRKRSERRPRRPRTAQRARLHLLRVRGHGDCPDQAQRPRRTRQGGGGIGSSADGGDQPASASWMPPSQPRPGTGPCPSGSNLGSGTRARFCGARLGKPLLHSLDVLTPQGNTNKV